MNNMKYAFIVFVALLPLMGCSKRETKLSAESSVVKAGKDVVEATGDALRGAAEGVNDAVYGRNK